MDKFRELQDAHQELLAQYVELLNRMSELPFFVDFISMKQVKSEDINHLKIWANISKIILTPFRFVFTLLAWKPFVKLFVEAHLHSKLKEISKSYIRLSQTIDFSKKGNQKKIEWLSKASMNCDSFASTLFSWLSLKGGLISLSNIVIGLILAWVGFDNIFQFVVNYDWSQNIQSVFIVTVTILISTIIYGGLVFILMLVSFQAKRILLFPNVDQKETQTIKLLPTTNIYKLENRLFANIGHKKALELPVDFLIMLAISCFIPLIVIILAFVFMVGDIPNVTTGSIIVAFLIFIIIPVMAGIPYVVGWKKREWR